MRRWGVCELRRGAASGVWGTEQFVLVPRWIPPWKEGARDVIGSEKRKAKAFGRFRLAFHFPRFILRQEVKI
jgi:hypothetical protein